VLLKVSEDLFRKCQIVRLRKFMKMSSRPDLSSLALNPETAKTIKRENSAQPSPHRQYPEILRPRTFILVSHLG
jgi:hypothetical protein